MSNQGMAKFSGTATATDGFIRRLVAFVLLINLLVIGATGYSLYRSFGSNEERARTTTRNLATVLSQNIEGAIGRVDVGLLAAADEIERQIASGKPDAGALSAYMTRLQGRLPWVIGLRATDERGLVKYGVDVPRDTKVDLSDREYFIRLRDDPQLGLFINKPVMSRINKVWVVNFARRLNHPDGRFAGVVFANISLENLSQLISSVNVGEHGSINLRDGELGLIVRYPGQQDPGSITGKHDASPQYRQAVRAGPSSGTFYSPVGFDGVARLASYQKIGPYPLYVSTGLARMDYLAAWQREALQISGLTLLFILVSSIGSWMVGRAWRQRLADTDKLAREEEKFHTVADYTYDWEYWEGPKHEILYMSPSCERVTGYSPAEFLADTELLSRIVLAEDLPLLEEHLHEVEQEDEVAVDFRIVRRDGKVRWIAHACQSVFGRAGQFMGRRVSNRDITERKRAEDALQLSSERLRLATRVAHIGIWDWDVVKNELVWDESMYQLYGLRSGDFGGAYDAWIRTIHPEDKAYTDGEIQAALRGEREYAPEFRVVWPDGSIRHIKADSHTTRDREGKPLRMIGTNIDITEHKQVEAKIRMLNQELEQRVAQRTAQLETALYDLENFNYSASHDLRIPLRAVDGFSSILLEEHSHQLDAEGIRLLKVVRNNTGRMSQLIDDMQAFSHAGRMPMAMTDVDMGALVREIVEELRPTTAGRKVSFEFGSLPTICTDRSMMRRIMLDLFANAIKFTRPKAAAQIEVGARSGDKETVFYVKDNGVGFDMKYADMLFGVFQRLHGVEEFEGAGIGLAIVKRIITRLGGRVWAEGKVNAGATLYFSLPHSTPKEVGREN